jgi:FkbM family methyltransferase
MLCAIHNEITTKTKHGVFTFSTRDQSIGASLFKYGKYEDYDYSLRSLKFLIEKNFVPKNKIDILDVGANIGVINIGLVLKGIINRAIAIEPEPVNYGFLKRNIEQNSISNRVLCLQAAVGDKSAMLTMELSQDNYGDHRIRVDRKNLTQERLSESARKTMNVRCLTLPEIMELPEVKAYGVLAPSLVWIDVQGYEGYVFKGGMNLLSKGLPTVSEIWPYGILRAGMALEEFNKIVASIWTDYWIERRGHFVRYPISVFDRYLEEIGNDGNYENTIFTKTDIKET